MSSKKKSSAGIASNLKLPIPYSTLDTRPSTLLSPAAFARISRAYRREWGLPLLAALPDGTVVLGPGKASGLRRQAAAEGVRNASGPRPRACSSLGTRQLALQTVRQHAIAEALRWGEPTVVEYPGRRLIWAVPLMHNAELIGGLLTIIPERLLGLGSRVSGALAMTQDPRLKTPFPVRKAAEGLRLLAERENLTNAALLAQRREEYAREQKRAEAIQDLKTRYFHSIREVYLREEPALISAVRQDDRPKARGILNRILVEIYAFGGQGELGRGQLPGVRKKSAKLTTDHWPPATGQDMRLIKSFLMELVVTMCRTAVECGGDPRELLGANYASISELSGIDTEEELSHWLVQMLERIMDSIQGSRGAARSQPRAATVLLQSAMKYLADHFDEPITRADVARVAGLSPPHFWRLVHQKVGRGFNDLLNQLRIDRAVELLRYTDKGVLQIALEVGFNDQSYFTKVFRRYLRMTPREYRSAKCQVPSAK